MPTTNDEHVDITFENIYDPELDTEYRGKVRKLVLDNGNYVWIESEDPFGHWKLSLKKGRLPDYIADNSYTTLIDVLRDLNRWLRERKYKLVYSTSKDKVSREE